MNMSLSTSSGGLISVTLSIWHKHMRKFLGNSEELFGMMIQPILWVILFGVGMKSLMGGVAPDGGENYIEFILPGIIALSAMGGAIGGGMAWLDERVRGIVKEYLVAPIPRFSILLGNAGSTATKAMFQAVVILLVGILMGAGLSTDPVGWLLGFLLLAGYALGFTGLALVVATKTDNIMAYHAMIMMLNLPVLFLSNARYPMASLPGWMKVGALANPTSYLVDGIRQTVLSGGGGLAANDTLPLWLCFTVTAGFAVLGLTAATRAFSAKTARG
jgi:ABC-2 type transport system permease protein